MGWYAWRLVIGVIFVSDEYLKISSTMKTMETLTQQGIKSLQLPVRQPTLHKELIETFAKGEDSASWEEKTDQR
jgi:hypothetical protein